VKEFLYANDFVPLWDSRVEMESRYFRLKKAVKDKGYNNEY